MKSGGSKDVSSFDRHCRVTAMLGTPATQLFKGEERLAIPGNLQVINVRPYDRNKCGTKQQTLSLVIAMSLGLITQKSSLSLNWQSQLMSVSVYVIME